MTKLYKKSLVSLIAMTVAMTSVSSMACSGHKKHHKLSQQSSIIGSTIVKPVK